MNIALIYDAVFPYKVGGVEHRNYLVARALAAEHEVALYSFDYWGSAGEERLERCRYVAIGRPVPFYDAHGRRRLSEPLYFAACLIRALLRSPEEIWDVASFPYFSVLVAGLVARLRRRCLIVTWYEVWGDSWYEYLGWKGFFGKVVEALALRCSSRIVAVSEHTRRCLLRSGVPARRIEVVPCPLDLKRIAAAPAHPRRAELVYAGRLMRHKQVDLAVMALGLLREELPEARLCIVGEGPERERLVELVRRLGLESCVEFAGFARSEDELSGRLKAGRVLVLPSRREGFGMTAIHAWACGLPAVVCDEPQSALPELVDHPLAGRVVASDPEAIARACLELLALDPAEVRAHVQERVKRYDLEEVGQRLGELYQRALRGPEAGAAS
jgi:glycosyltransferase involved in cell wall biosynthesis